MLNAFLICCIVVAFSCLIFKVACFLEDEERLDNHAVVINDFTFRDNHGNVWVVTASHIDDAFDLLVEDHNLNSHYVRTNVFLAHSAPAFHVKGF